MAAVVKNTASGSDLKPVTGFALVLDLIVTALVTLCILTPMVAIKTVADQEGLSYYMRWPYVAGMVAIVLAVRLLLYILIWNPAAAPDAPAEETLELARISGDIPTSAGWGDGQQAGVLAPDAPPPAPSFLPPETPLPGSVNAIKPARYLGIALLAFALVLPLIAGWTPWGTGRTVDLAITILIYIMLGWGLNIVVGLAGLLDLGYVAFYAVGAYAYALLTTVYLPQWFGTGVVPWAFYLVLPIAGMLAATWGILLGFPVLRLRGDYLAIVTLAFGEIIRLVLLNWFDFTNGPQGISVPKATFFGIPFVDDEGGFAATFGLTYSPNQFYIFLYYVILALALLTSFVTNRLRALPLGRAWEALREDEIACRALGINTTVTKLSAFSIGAMFGGFAGSFFAARQGFVSPESFTYFESALILAIVVLGGLGSQIGIVFSATVIIGAFEVLREIGTIKAILPESLQPPDWFQPDQYRMLAVGLAMVLMMRWKPRGFISRRDPTVFLKEKKSVSADHVAQGHG